MPIILRVMVDAVFFLEGIQKFLYPEYVGVGRFERIGIPAPEVMGPFVGGLEIVCGLLILVGLLTRAAALQTLCIMAVAIITTKIPILLGTEFLGFSLRKVSYYGFLGFAHESRTDWSMALGSIYLIISGGGRWSMDAWLMRNAEAPASPQSQLHPGD